VISGFHREVDEACALLGCYAASSGNFLRTFRDNTSVPSSGYSLVVVYKNMYNVCVCVCLERAPIFIIAVGFWRTV